MIDTYLGPFQRTVLDFGCGTGHLAKFLVEHGYNVAGIDLSRRARKSTRGQVDIPVYKGIKELKDSHPDLRFNAVILLNVLEHVANPEALLYKIKSVISYDGLIIARVPNDFSLLQAAARQALDIDPWWISYPDHISYFGFKSLASLLVDSGFRILNEMGDFPMEFFLLFGDDYISDPSLGKKCHTKRRNFELAIPTEIRQEMYRDFAKRGMGRNCLITAQLAE
jgi:SAM-dependent methyltransferase